MPASELVGLGSGEAVRFLKDPWTTRACKSSRTLTAQMINVVSFLGLVMPVIY